MTRSDSGPRREHVSLVVAFGRLDLRLARLLGRSTPRAPIAKIAGFRFQALVRKSILSSGLVSITACICPFLAGGLFPSFHAVEWAPSTASSATGSSQREV